MVCFRLFLASLFVFFLFPVGPASAFNANIAEGSISLSSTGLIIGGGGTGSEPISDPENSDETYQHQIFVDGNLYLDFSLFGQSGGMLEIPGDLRFSATETIWIGGFEDEAPQPDLNSFTLLSYLPLSLNTVGDFLLFSRSPIDSGSFEATGSIYVGNYSSLAPVPLPGSLIFFVSGLAWIIRKASVRTEAN